MGRDDLEGSPDLQAPSWSPERRAAGSTPKSLTLCPQMDCLRQLHSGLLLYQGLLQALAGISPELAPTLDLLQLDITDLATNIWQQVSFIGSS